MLGGTQSLHTNSFDEALALPTEKAARIALRTQQVIAHETGVTNVADPLGGSWYVEALTDEMERQAEEIFARIAEMGDGSMLEGAYAGIDNGYYQSEIADAAYAFERKLNNGSRVMVGVNGFTEGNEDAQPDLLEITLEQEMDADQAAAGGPRRPRRRGRPGGAGDAARRGGRPGAEPHAGADRHACAPTPPRARSWTRWRTCSGATWSGRSSERRRGASTNRRARRARRAGAARGADQGHHDERGQHARRDQQRRP